MGGGFVCPLSDWFDEMHRVSTSLDGWFTVGDDSIEYEENQPKHQYLYMFPIAQTPIVVSLTRMPNVYVRMRQNEF